MDKTNLHASLDDRFQSKFITANGVHILRNCGHYHAEEKPAELLEALFQFLPSPKTTV